MPNQRPSQPSVSDAQDFATTHWSLVIAAGDLENVRAHEALCRLCETYWLPLYAYVRRRVPDVAKAQDLTQAFFAELLEKDFVKAADPNRGHFRAFLLTAFKHFLSKQREKERAQKRGGGRAPLSLNFAAADSSLIFEPSGGLTAEQLYDRQWAVTLLEQVMQRLAKEFERSGKTQQYEILREHLVGTQTGTTYSIAAEALGVSEAAARQAASRMRRRYRELLREEIAQTVAGPDDVQEEIHKLFAVFEM